MCIHNILPIICEIQYFEIHCPLGNRYNMCVCVFTDAVCSDATYVSSCRCCVVKAENDASIFCFHFDVLLKYGSFCAFILCEVHSSSELFHSIQLKLFDFFASYVEVVATTNWLLKDFFPPLIVHPTFECSIWKEKNKVDYTKGFFFEKLLYPTFKSDSKCRTSVS